MIRAAPPAIGLCHLPPALRQELLVLHPRAPRCRPGSSCRFAPRL